MANPADQWKNPQQSPQGAKPPRHRNWQPPTNPVTPRQTLPDPARKRRRQLILACFVGTILLGVIIGLKIMLQPPQPTTLVLVAPDLETVFALPDHPSGLQSIQSLSEWAKGHPQDARLSDLSDDQPLTQAWQAELDRGHDGPLVLYFTAPAGVDDQGPYLWLPPAETKTLSDAHKLHVETILTRLAKLPADRPKLLVFDVGHHPIGWSQGRFMNRFPEGLKRLDSKINEIDGLVIICSTETGQQSWISEEWQQPIFAVYFKHALTGKVVESVRADNLFDYLHTSVPIWTRANRAATQTPILLPKAEGLKRAAQIELVRYAEVERASIPDPGSAPGRSFTLPKALATAWAEREKLAEQSPPPETTAPMLWRAYLDTLMRYEQRIRLGTSATNLAKQLGRLQDQLSPSLFRGRPDSLANALPVAAALGLSHAADWEPTPEKLTVLWNAAIEGKRSTWEDLVVKARQQGDRRLLGLRLATAKFVVKRFQTRNTPPTRKELSTLATLLSWFDGRIDPIETHLLWMVALHADPIALETPQYLEEVQFAWQTRLQAEQIAWMDGAAQPEQVFPWVQPLLLNTTRTEVAGADQERMLGEDYLFASEESNGWGLARGYLEKARERYRQAKRVIEIIKDGYAVRDRVFAQLPYYARWVAELDPQGQAELIADVEELARLAHALDQALTQPHREADKVLTEVEAIRKLVEPLDHAFATLVQHYRQATDPLSRQAIQENLAALRNALQVPFVSGTRRKQLLHDFRAVSQALLDDFSPDQVEQESLVQGSDRSRGRVKIHARLALALLGPYQKTDPLSVDGREGTLRKTEVSLRNGWSALPETIARSMSGLADSTPAEAIATLSRAEAMSRLLESATPLADEVPNPTEELRLHRMQAFLRWHALRTNIDYWAHANPQASEPAYWKQASQAYADAAASLATDGTPWEKLLLRETVFRMDYPQRLPLIDTNPWEVRYTIQPQIAAARAVPILRRGELPRFLKPRAPIQPARLPLTELGNSDPASEVTRQLEFAFTETKKPGSEFQLAADLFYRGHRYPMTTDVILSKEPDLRYVHKPAEGKAAIAVVADSGLVNGGVAMLIDVTNSMNRKQGEKTKLQLVKAAVERFVDELPEGTQLSILTFYGPTRIGQPQIDTIVPSRRWYRRDRQAVLDQVNKITTKASWTPLGRTVNKMLRQRLGFPPQFDGVRTIILLTDGRDSSEDGERGDQVFSTPGQLMVDAWTRDAREHPEHVVNFHLVLFALDNRQKSKAYQQLKPFSDRFDRPDDPHIHEANELDQVVRSFRNAIRPRVWLYDRTTAEPVKGLETGFPATLREEKGLRLSPLLPPDVYELWDGKYRVRLPLQVQAGDRLVIDWKRSETPFRVLSWADVFRKEPPRVANGDYHLTVPRNALSSLGMLRCQLTLEHELATKVGLLRRDRPLLAWFDLQPLQRALPSRPSRMTIRNVPEPTIAPTYELEVYPWVPARDSKDLLGSPAKVQLQAYWIDRFPPNPEAIVLTLPIVDDELTDYPDQIRVRDMDVSFRRIWVDQGVLTIEMACSGDDLILAQSPDFRRNDQELGVAQTHEYYFKQRLYRVRFGPLNRKLMGREVRLEFHRLDQVKQQARERSLNLRLSSPTPSSQTPSLLEQVPLKTVR